MYGKRRLSLGCETLENNTQNENNEALKSAKVFSLTAYVLFFLGIVSLGTFSIIGVILAYTRRKGLQGTIYYGHLSYLIQTFWIFFLFEIIGMLLVNLRGIGIIILIISYLWYLYRLVSGVTKLSDNKAI